MAFGYSRGAVIAACFASMFGCDLAPSHIKRTTDIDAYLAQGRYNAACVGLTMEDSAEIRTYAATKLKEYPNEPVATTCLCEELYDASKHKWDAAIAEGLVASRRDDLAACLAPALTDPNITDVEDRTLLTMALAKIVAPAGFAAIGAALPTEKDDDLRALQAKQLQPSDAHVDLLLSLLGSDPSAEVRASAAEALKGRSEPKVVEKMLEAAQKDAAGIVRAEALLGVVKLRLPQTDEMVCRAMLEDPEEPVRVAAVKSYKGTKRPEALACLKKRALTEDTSGAVREAVLEALGASPSDEAAQVLCDIVGPWVKMYITDKLYTDIPGSDVVKAQNNRDFERSLECAQKGLGYGGHSCYGRNYLGHWVKELGGNAPTPWCPGMVKTGGAE